MIPVFRMEEHCEAYVIWHIGLDEGLIPARDNVLLHVDHHDDLDSGYYTRDLSTPVTSAQEALKICREDLGIADFIVPAFWEGIFGSMVNFKSIFPADKGREERVVRLNNGNELIFRNYIPLTDSGCTEDELKKVDYIESSLNPLPETDRPVVLDIDLDYFCWDNTLSTGRDPRIEITEESYRNFIEDPRHPMRITAKRIMRVECEEGKYYLCIRHASPKPKVTREERIRQRVDKFFNWLKETGITPAMIDICRSRISGYCPSDRWELVESLVLEGLKKLYEIEIRDDLLVTF